MSELFTEVASIDYPIIDSDAHVNEPPDLWQERVPSRLRNRAPKVMHTDDGDVWSFDDGKKLRPLGLTATAGLSYLQFRPSGMKYDTIRPGSFDTAARLFDLDADGIYAQVLYPSVTLAGARTYSEDRELQGACVRAYNEWLLDFCKPSRRAPHPTGDHPHDRHRRRARRAGVVDQARPPWRAHRRVPQRHLRTHGR